MIISSSFQPKLRKMLAFLASLCGVATTALMAAARLVCFSFLSLAPTEKHMQEACFGTPKGNLFTTENLNIKIKQNDDPLITSRVCNLRPWVQARL